MVGDNKQNKDMNPRSDPIFHIGSDKNLQNFCSWEKLWEVPCTHATFSNQLSSGPEYQLLLKRQSLNQSVQTEEQSHTGCLAH